MFFKHKFYVKQAIRYSKEPSMVVIDCNLQKVNFLYAKMNPRSTHLVETQEGLQKSNDLQ